MSTYEVTDDAAEPIVAVFPDGESANAVLEALHRAGFRRYWLGLTRPDTPPEGEPQIATENAGGLLAALGRFLGGDESEALRDALVTHGLDEAQARRLEGGIAPGNAVVLVDGEYDPALAIRILESGGGRLEPSAEVANTPTSPTVHQLSIDPH